VFCPAKKQLIVETKWQPPRKRVKARGRKKTFSNLRGKGLGKNSSVSRGGREEVERSLKKKKKGEGKKRFRERPQEGFVRHRTCLTSFEDSGK